MHTLATPGTLRAAADYLASHDPNLAPAIAKYGLCTIAPHANYYQDLVESIIGQQLSVKAAATIKQRFKGLFDSQLPSPEQILATPIEDLRSVGLSKQKITYIRDLSRHIIDGQIKFDHLDSLSNEEIIQELTAVKGIGEWTVHMFLIFCMGRLDVLAHGDLGIRSGIKKIYSLDHLPTPNEVKAIAQLHQWHPYESVACWYVWQVLDNKPLAN